MRLWRNVYTGCVVPDGEWSRQTAMSVPTGFVATALTRQRAELEMEAEMKKLAALISPLIHYADAPNQ